MMGSIWIGWAVLALSCTVCVAIWSLIGLGSHVRRLEERNAAQAATIAGLQKRLRHDEMPDMREVEKAWDRMLAASQRSGPRCPEPSPTNEIRSIWDKQARADESAEILQYEASARRKRHDAPKTYDEWRRWEADMGANAESVRKVKDRLFGEQD